MITRTRQSICTILIILTLIIITSCTGTDAVSSTSFEKTPKPANGIPTLERELNADWYEIYFTDPDCPPEEARTGGLDTLIAEDLLQAQTQVDIAAYDLDAQPIVDALLELEERGVLVRIVTDEDNGDLPAIRRLRRGGISVIEDKRSGLMHNKFIVIDGHIVYTGSLNFTSNGIYCNNNNLVRINSSRIADNYTTEMDEMVKERQFGPTSFDNTPRENLTINNIEIENYFSPEFKAADLIAEKITNAQEEILFMAFVLTEEQIGEALMARAADGVTVRGVFDTVGSSSEFSYYAPMRVSDLPNLEVWQDGNSGAMHHKIIIIDRETVILGSFNFSESANSNNDENILIVHDPVFASYFVEEFETVLEEAKTQGLGQN